MGTCCASRTDMDGKDKTAAAAKSKAAGSAANKGEPAVNFNAMDTVRNTVT